ncbi:uncharacterized protein LOC118733741 [Rhagoletis pomonella]|uniref:uncharacterized protein LOC118733741 n=1 Tax=Rhagoletis pomonella TaxID=28610 RepID=UPI0017826324|nr:uncharacterized protein LOC118733741 [Rhagoletis pomonella]
MAEAVLCRSAAKLRELFAILVSTCGLSNPLNLWNKYKADLSEDIAYRLQDTHNDIIYNEALVLIEDKMLTISGKCLADFGLPTPQRRGEISSDVARELSYDIPVLQSHVRETTPKLLPEQHAVVNVILNRLSSGEGLFFLDAPGGTGKTFVLNLLLAHA